MEAGDPTLIPLSRLWEAGGFEFCQEIVSQLRTLPGWNEARVTKAVQRLERALEMLEQSVPCTTLHGGSDQEATEIFRRLNKGGVALRQSDVEAAELAREYAVGVLSAMQDFVNEERPLRLGFGLSFALRALVLFHRKTAQLKKLPSEWFKLGGPDGRSLEDSWRVAERALRRAFDYVEAQMGWSRRALLPSANALIILAAALDKGGFELDEKSELLYRRWLCLTALRGVFHGAVETTMNRFYKALDKHKGNPANALLDALKGGEGGKIGHKELTASSQPWSAPVQVMYAWLAAHKAQDWLLGTQLTDLVPATGVNLPFGELTVHHIFPRKVVADLLVDPNPANTPANYALVSRETNSKLKDKPPSEALALLSPEQRSRAAVQFFGPEAGDMLEPHDDRLLEFWDWRAKRLAKALNEWLGMG